MEKVLDDALLSHDHWHADLMRRLICHLPFSDTVMAHDGHLHCGFGSWFYGMGKIQVEKLPAFVKIGALHKSMHDNAREVCLKVKATGYAPEEDYDAFVHSLESFRQELTSLKHRVSMLSQANPPETPPQDKPMQ
jgi:diguanylate cyclase